jgi:hypothetical protein
MGHAEDHVHHHLDTFRYWFGDPQQIYCSVRLIRGRSLSIAMGSAVTSSNMKMVCAASELTTLGWARREGCRRIFISDGESRD